MMEQRERLDRLRELLALASEADSDNRRNLLRRVTDVFISHAGDYTEHQKTEFGRIMSQLAERLESSVRQELAHRLAKETHAPPDVIRRLATDEIAVARPVLEHSPVLTQDDLVSVAETKGDEHLFAISGRSDVGPRLSESLVRRGNDSVVERLLRNPSAKLGARTLRQVVARAAGSDAIAPALIDRNDVPPQLLIGLLDHLSSKIESEFSDAFSPEQARKLQDVVNSLKLRIRGAEHSRTELYIEELERRGALNEATLVGFALREKPMEFLVGMARLARLDLDAAQRLLLDDTGRALAIVCRSLDFSPDAFKAIVLSPVTGIPCEPETVQPLLRSYILLKKSVADRAMRFWHMRKSIGLPGNAPEEAA